MKISEFSVKRPVAAVMFFLIVMLLGAVAFTKLKIDYFPDMTFPLISVLTSYPGGGPEELENYITRNIEEAVSTVKHLKHVRSISKENLSVVMVEFEWGINMDYAAQEVRDKIDPVIENLPRGAKRPILVKFDPNVIMPLMDIVIAGPQSPLELRSLAEHIIKKQLEKISGVGAVTVEGGLERCIRVEIDEKRLRAFHIPISQVCQALLAENVNLTGGRLDEGETEFQIRTPGEFKSPGEMEKIAVATRNGRAVCLREVAKVLDTAKEQRSFARMGGKEVAACAITKQSVANTVEVAERVKKALPGIQGMLPSGTELVIVLDQGRFIRQAVGNTQAMAFEGGLLAMVIIYLFLTSGRSTLVIAISIPASIIATFVLMHFKGMTINVITLGGLTLGIGRIVDDSIVVLENIYRHIERGSPPMTAAVQGAQEVGMAVAASTFTTIAVFLPIMFAGGVAQQIFGPMALTVSFSLFASLAVALTLIPMLCSRVMSRDNVAAGHDTAPAEGSRTPSLKVTVKRFVGRWQVLFHSLEALYRRMLSWCLSHRPAVVGLGVASLVAGVLLLVLVGVEFMSKQDRSEFVINAICPPGTALSSTDRVMQDIHRFVGTIPEVKTVVGVTGTDEGNAMAQMESKGARSGMILVELLPIKERKRSQFDVEQLIRKKLADLPGTDARIMEMTEQSGEADMELKIYGSDLKTLSRLGEECKRQFRQIPGVSQVALSWEEGNPEYHILVDREKAGACGIPVSQVASTVRTLVKGEDVTKFRDRGEEYDITVQSRQKDRDWVQQVEDLELQTGSGAVVPLKEVAKVVRAQGPSELTREDRQRNISITAGKTTRPLGDIVRDMDKALASIPFPPGYTWKHAGMEEQRQESFQAMGLALVAGILLIYFILAAQFESLVHPFTIMLAIPLEVVGVFMALFLAREPLSVTAFLGILMLTGIVVSNSILLVNYINILRERGLERREAILEAGPVRLRPILMTAICTVFAMLPMAMAVREGSETFRPLAIAVIGGLITSTFLTLLVIPVAYSLIDDLGVKLRLVKKDGLIS